MFDLDQWANQVLQRHHFSGQQPDEEMVILARRHPLFLGVALALPLLILFVSLGFILAGAIAALLLIPVAALWMGLAFIEWENDQYILTSQRVIAIKRIFRIFEERREAPLTKIQDITITVPGILAHLLDYADLDIATASALGRVRFSRVGRPLRVKEAIFHQQQLALEREQEGRRLEFRERLGEELGYPGRPG